MALEWYLFVCVLSFTCNLSSTTWDIHKFLFFKKPLCCEFVILSCVEKMSAPAVCAFYPACTEAVLKKTLNWFSQRTKNGFGLSLLFVGFGTKRQNSKTCCAHTMAATGTASWVTIDFFGDKPARPVQKAHTLSFFVIVQLLSQSVEMMKHTCTAWKCTLTTVTYRVKMTNPSTIKHSSG